MEHQRVTKSAQKEHPKIPSSTLHQTSLNGVRSHPLLQLQRTIGNQAVVRMLRSQNQKSDTQHPPLHKQSAEPGTTTTTESSNVPTVVDDVLNSAGGQPLDTATRAFMEPRFGQDFSQVRVHTDEQATRSAQAVNALAYTVGRDVVFGQGLYHPETSEGRRLLAHELTHVVQQNRDQTQLTRKLEVVTPSDPLETEAERAANAIAHDGSAIGISMGQANSPPQGRLYRQPQGSSRGDKGPIASRKIDLDASVIDELNRGNTTVAADFKKLKASGAQLRINAPAYIELTQKGNLQLRKANELLINEIGVQKVLTAYTLEERTEGYAHIAGKGVKLQAKDTPMVLLAQKEGAELWTFDTGVKQNAPLVGVPVIPESNTEKTGKPRNYAVARKLMGLEEIEISPTGVVITPSRPGGGGSTSSGTPSGSSGVEEHEATPRVSRPAPVEKSEVIGPGTTQTGPRKAPSKAPTTFHEEAGAPKLPTSTVPSSKSKISIKDIGHAVGSAAGGILFGILESKIRNEMERPYRERDWRYIDQQVQEKLITLEPELRALRERSMGIIYANITVVETTTMQLEFDSGEYAEAVSSHEEYNDTKFVSMRVSLDDINTPVKYEYESHVLSRIDHDYYTYSVPIPFAIEQESAGPQPGTGAYAASLGISLSKVDRETHWKSQQERSAFILDYIRYAQEHSELRSLYQEAMRDYPTEEK